MSLKLLHETETEDPILSVVNLIDIFLVIIAALLITVAQNPLLNPFNKQDVTVITDPGKPNMEMVVKKGEKIEHYKASGEIGDLEWLAELLELFDAQAGQFHDAASARRASRMPG